MPGWHDLEVDTFQTVLKWLRDEHHGKSLTILDNADDNQIFFSKSHSMLEGHQTASLAIYLPHGSNDFILFTTRDLRVGERLVDRTESIVVLPFGVQAV